MQGVEMHTRGLVRGMKRTDIGRILSMSTERAQLCVAIEELSELTKEICKYQRDPIMEKHYDFIKEELADVMIVCKEIQVLFGISEDELNDETEFKISRTLERLKND